MNRNGFTLIEVLIASLLIVSLIAAGAVGFHQMNVLTQVASSRTAHSEVRAKVLDMLMSSGSCTSLLVPSGGGPPTLAGGVSTVTNQTQIPIDHITNGGAGVVLQSGTPALNQIDAGQASQGQGLLYQIAITFPHPNSIVNYSPSIGRPNGSTLFVTHLEITGQRANLNQNLSAKDPITGVMGEQLGANQLFGTIPLSAEFDNSTGQMISCTVNPAEIDEKLAGGNHSVRDCVQAGGAPFPTELGMVCRFPVFPGPQIPVPPLTSTTYPTGIGPGNDGIPLCATVAPPPAIPGGPVWQDAIPTLAPGAVNYNSSLPVDIPLITCSGKAWADSGWHPFSRLSVEKRSLFVKKGTASHYWAWVSGAAVIGLTLDVIMPGVGTMLAAAFAVTLAAIDFVISIFTHCKSETFTFYSQINGVGCI